MLHMLAVLGAVCLLQVNEGHHRDNYNYSFKDYVCSDANLGVPVDCTELDTLFELRDHIRPEDWLKIIPYGIEHKLQEVYDTCCAEA